MMILNDKYNKIEQKTILLLFNSINNYGDRSMNQELFMLLQKKTYINFLCLREKTKSENNFVKFLNNNNNNINNLDTRSNSINYIPGEIYRTATFESAKSSDKIFKKINKKLFNFVIPTFCMKNINEKNSTNLDINEDISMNFILNSDNKEENLNINENKICGEPVSFTIKDLFDNENNKKYIEIKCPKCQKIQNITIKCYYSDEYNNKFILNFDLLSPLALLKEPWFKNFNQLDLLVISQEYPEQYLCALFYFYEQGLPCNFLIPKGISKQDLKEENISKPNNLDTFIYDSNTETYMNKQKLSCFYSPNITKRDFNINEKVKNFYFNNLLKEDQKKSPSPKKSSFLKKKDIGQKLKTTSDFKKKNVTFSCFKK